MTSDIDIQIDKIKMHEMTGEEALKQINPNSLKARLNRRQIRYWLYKIKGSLTERSDGTFTTLPEDIPSGFQESYEEQHGFDGWGNFAVTWDVELHDPEVLVSRLFSEEEEWHRIIMAKFPQIQPDGSIKYPDMRVKKAVDEEIKNQEELKKRK